MARRGGLLGFFRNIFRSIDEQIARTQARRAERGYGRKIRDWEATQEPDVVAKDLRRDTSDMSASELRAYAKKLTRGKNAIDVAGIMSSGSELLDVDAWRKYERLWREREEQKRNALRATKLKGIPQTRRMGLLDVDPETGELKKERGGTLVLTLLGDEAPKPASEAVLERRIEQMRGWKSVESRLDQSEANVEKKLGIISSTLVDEWKKLNRAQKQHLINNERIFDLLNVFTFSTKIEEVRAFIKLHPEKFEQELDELTTMINDASKLEREFEDEEN